MVNCVRILELVRNVVLTFVSDVFGMHVSSFFYSEQVFFRPFSYIIPFQQLQDRPNDRLQIYYSSDTRLHEFWPQCVQRNPSHRMDPRSASSPFRHLSLTGKTRAANYFGGCNRSTQLNMRLMELAVRMHIYITQALSQTCSPLHGKPQLDMR